jgi:CO dehydrogenase maturation factor
MIIAVAGKGGTGKTSLLALILDELARLRYPGRILAVDGDPAQTLSLALGVAAPLATIADVREATSLDARTIHSLPAGMTPAGYLLTQLRQAGVLAPSRLRSLRFELLVMGAGTGPGCYCQVNAALKSILAGLVSRYDLVLVDNDAGLEHLSRYRLGRIDLLLPVATPTRAAQLVAGRVVETARAVGIELGDVWPIYNQVPLTFIPPETSGPVAVIPRTLEMVRLEQRGRPVVDLDDDDPVREALRGIVERVRSCV